MLTIVEYEFNYSASSHCRSLNEIGPLYRSAVNFNITELNGRIDPRIGLIMYND